MVYWFNCRRVGFLLLNSTQKSNKIGLIFEDIFIWCFMWNIIITFCKFYCTVFIQISLKVQLSEIFATNSTVIPEKKSHVKFFCYTSCNPFSESFYIHVFIIILIHTSHCVSVFVFSISLHIYLVLVLPSVLVVFMVYCYSFSCCMLTQIPPD